MKSSEPLNPETIITRAPGVFTSEWDGTLLVAARRGGQGHCLDPTGLAIWEILAEPCSIKNLCARLRQRYDVEGTEWERDVLEFTAELIEKMMVIIVKPES